MLYPSHVLHLVLHRTPPTHVASYTGLLVHRMPPTQDAFCTGRLLYTPTSRAREFFAKPRILRKSVGRAVASIRQTEALASVIFFLFVVVFKCSHKHAKYLGRKLTMDIASVIFFFWLFLATALVGPLSKDRLHSFFIFLKALPHDAWKTTSFLYLWRPC